jgi:hypothetical protein
MVSEPGLVTKHRAPVMLLSQSGRHQEAPSKGADLHCGLGLPL